MIITIAHLRKAGMCSRQPRQWFARHGLSWSDFIDHGIPEEDVLATGDELGAMVVRKAHEDGE